MPAGTGEACSTHPLTLLPRRPQVLPSILPPSGVGGMAGSFIDVPALPQPVDVTATPASSSSGGGSGGSSSGSGGAASNIVPAAKEGSGPSSSGSKEGGGGGSSGKAVTVTVASTSGASAQQELAAQAAAATAAAVLQDPATLSKIAAAISPDDIIANPQTAGINVLASYDVSDDLPR